MGIDATDNGDTTIIFDGWRSISFAVFMALVGYSVMVTVPVLSTALVDQLGFSAEQVGRVWGNDLLGLAIGAVLSAYFVCRVNRRSLVLVGVALCIGANAACMFITEYEPMMWVRVAAGIGSGIFTGTAVATIGGTSRPERAFNILLLGFSFSAAFELNLFPKLSLNGIYLFLMGTAALCALFLRWLPTRPLNDEELLLQEKFEDHLEDWHVPKLLPIICLVAVCFTYINIGGYFTYIELAALADGLTTAETGPLLTWSSFLALAGCILALICSRFGLFRPLFAALFTMAVLVAMLSGGVTYMNLLVSMFMFMAMWTFVDVFQSAMMGHMDRSGSLVALLPAVQGFGQFVGPNIAASIIGVGLAVGTVSTVTSDTVPAGNVISQNPVACTVCTSPGSTIDLVVSSGQESANGPGSGTESSNDQEVYVDRPQIDIPNVVGRAQSDAELAIINSGLNYSTMFMVSGSMALVAMFLYGGIYIFMHRRRRELVPAEAT